ncbi:MAG TPA: nucleotidyltransferase family protein [Acidimicrobiales bacterium]
MAIASHGLAGSRLDMPEGPLPDDQWAELLHACRSQELLGYLAGAVAAGTLAVTDAQADELDVLEAESAGLSLLVEQRLVTLATSLAAAGIDYRVVDGPARCQLGYADACLRHFETVDIVVEPGYVKLATAMKGAPGGHFRNTHRARRRPRIGVRATVLPPGPHEAIVDLTDLAGTQDQPDARATITLGGHHLAALPPEEQLVCTAIEAVGDRGDRRIVLLRDVAELTLSPQLDAARVRRLAEGWNVADVVVTALREAWWTFDLADKTVLSVWSERYALRPVARGGLSARTARTDDRRWSVVDTMQRLLGRRGHSPGPLSTVRFR